MAEVDPSHVRLPDASRQLAIFANQLNTLLGAGVPLLQSLLVLGEQFEDPITGKVLNTVAEKVAAGSSLSQALSTYPRVFSKVFVGLVQAGEATGNLDKSLVRLSRMLEQSDKLRQRLTAAFAYPLFVLATTVVLTLFVFYTVLPNFVEIFRNMNVPLPLLTRMLIFLTDAIRNPGCWLIAAGLGVLGYLGLQKTLSTTAGKLRLFRALMFVPLAGPIVRFSCLASYCWVMESVLGSGIDLLRCVRLAAAACGSPEIQDDAENLCQSIRQGDDLSVHFHKYSEIYSLLMANMTMAAEQSSSVQTAFERMGGWFNLEMECRVDLLNAAIEPLLMAFVATIVGTIVVAIFLPLYGFLGSMGS